MVRDTNSIRGGRPKCHSKVRGDEVKDPLLAALERNSVVVRTSVVSAFTSEVALAALEVTAAGGDPSSQWMALKANL